MTRHRNCPTCLCVDVAAKRRAAAEGRDELIRNRVLSGEWFLDIARDLGVRSVAIRNAYVRAGKRLGFICVTCGKPIDPWERPRKGSYGFTPRNPTVDELLFCTEINTDEVKRIGTRLTELTTEECRQIRINLTAAQRGLRILRLRKAGASYKKLAAQFGISTSRVSEILSRARDLYDRPTVVRQLAQRMKPSGQTAGDVQPKGEQS